MRTERVIQVMNIVDDTDIGFKNPQRGRVYSSEGIAPALNCCGGGNLEPKIITDMEETTNIGISVHPFSHRLEFDCMNDIKKDVAPCLRATDYKAPHCVWEMKTDRVINIGCVEYDDHSRTHQQDFVQSAEGICRTIPAGTHGSTPHLLKTLVTEENMETKEKSFKLPKELYGKKFRIRKLTNRECYRLQGCDEETIDTLLATDISRSKHYCLAGNSITVDVLYFIFKKMFIDTSNEDQQLSLF